MRKSLWNPVVSAASPVPGTGVFVPGGARLLTYATGMLPTPSESVIFRRLETGAVVYDSAVEVYYGLNDVGATIWELLGDASLTSDRLIDRLGSKYPDADGELLRADCDALIASLVGYGLLRLAATTA